MARPRNEDPTEDAKKIVDDAKSFIEKAISDIGTTSATKQLLLGTASGWTFAVLEVVNGREYNNTPTRFLPKLFLELLSFDGICNDIMWFIVFILSMMRSSSEWFNCKLITGFISMKIGKVAAVGLGGSVILLHIASQKGYIDINWDKINKKVDKITDKIEKEATGKGPNWSEKLERFVDRKLDKAEGLLKKKEHKAKKWYSNFTGDDHYHATESHVFMASFVAGMALGLLCGK